MKFYLIVYWQPGAPLIAFLAMSEMLPDLQPPTFLTRGAASNLSCVCQDAARSHL